MRFFTKFPYTNLNNLNLDWIIERIRNIEEFLSGVSDSIEAAQAAADSAQAAADSAQESANSAIEAIEALPDLTEMSNDVTALKTSLNREILYFENVAVTPATNAQVMRIPATGANSLITTNSVILECFLDNDAAITSDITFTSYNGYIIGVGSAALSTIAAVTIGTKNN